MLQSFRRSLPHIAAVLSTTTTTVSAAAMTSAPRVVDPLYPGTSVARLNAAHERIGSLKPEALTGEWEGVRQQLLWCAGLKDLQNAAPGQGYTGHAFNDANHCDATTMLGDVSHNLNEAGPNRVSGIAIGNRCARL